LSESSFITGGLIPVSTLIEKLGFQWAYAVNHRLEIAETLVCVNTSLEYEAHLDPIPKCGESILFESLILARKYVFGKNIEKKNTLKETVITRKGSLAYKLSSLWHKFFPSDKGVKPAIDHFANYAEKEIKNLHSDSYEQIEFKPLPREFKCGAILPLGTNVYNLRADDILFDGKFTLNASEVTSAEPMYILLDKKEMHIRYCLDNSRNYMLDPDDAAEDGILKKCFSNSRYFADKKAAIKTFDELKKIVSLHIK
jgi:hypothetical protein